MQMLFLDTFPELTAAPPTLPGEPTRAATVLDQLRRQQLHDLARAFDIDVPKDGTKKEILPPLLAAEASGIFRTQPKRPEYLAKAGRSADEPPSDEWLKHRIDTDTMDIRHLRELAKKHDINSFQKSAEALRSELEAVGAF
jgi:hypothetical protein